MCNYFIYGEEVTLQSKNGNDECYRKIKSLDTENQSSPEMVKNSRKEKKNFFFVVTQGKINRQTKKVSANNLIIWFHFRLMEVAK